MPAYQRPRWGLLTGFAPGDPNWGTDPGGYNDLARRLDAGLHLRVASLTAINTPPGSPANGGAHIVGGVPTGDFTGEAGKIAVWDSDAAAWFFFAPPAGTVATASDTGEIGVYNGTAFVVPPNIAPSARLIERWVAVGGETERTISVPAWARGLRGNMQARLSAMGAGNTIRAYFNSDFTEANYRFNRHNSYGRNSSSSAPELHTGDNNFAAAPNAIAAEFSAPNIAGTVFNKALLGKTDTRLTAELIPQEIAAQWLSTAAVTSLTIRAVGGATFLAGSTITLYGET